MEEKTEEISLNNEIPETRTRLVSFSKDLKFDDDVPSPGKYSRRESVSISVDKLQTDVNVVDNVDTEKHDNDIIIEKHNFKRTRPIRPVVKVREAVKRYDMTVPPVLNGFNMTVEEGTIYSLLGASGCGKTTVLTCILGMRYLESGRILLFGKPPHAKGTGIPGNRVGYMPQENALYGNLSIDETLLYYGALFGMTTVEVKASRDYLIAALDLPDETKRLRDLSSGQQRRVSLAVALIHSPELVVLDEPTVGMDSLLRERIWDHLLYLVAETRTTIILTTHHAEEARRSHMIGLMRTGRLMAENDPEKLLQKHKTSLLEDIVLKFCKNDKFGIEDHCYSKEKNELKALEIRRNSLYPTTADEGDTDKDLFEYNRSRRESIASRNSVIFNPQDFKRPSELALTVQRIKALTLKNFFVMWRNFLLVLFMIMTPSFMVYLVCHGVGNDPQTLNFGIVNREVNLTHCLEFLDLREKQELTIEEEGCELEKFSCKFLERIPKDAMFMIEYNTVKEAQQAVKRGDTWGYLAFPDNYSANVVNRTSSGNTLDEKTLDGSFITYQLDSSSKHVSTYVQKMLGDAYEAFIKRFLVTCGMNPKFGDRPVKALPPLHGTVDTDLNEFVAPSMLVGFLFFFPLCSSAVLYIYDKNQGTFERARVGGVRTSEVMASYFISEGTILAIQLILSLAIITLIFGFKIKGSLVLIVILYLLMGFAGVSAGFLFGSFCNEEVQAVLLAMAAFFPNFLLSGLLWPIEGMPIAMQYVAYILPCTFPAESVRSIISRGWGFTHIRVFPGFVTSVLWICVYSAVTVITHRILFRRK